MLHDACPVHLAHAQQTIRSNAYRLGNLTPSGLGRRGARRSQTPWTRREDACRQRLESSADKRRPRWGRDPIKTVGGAWQYHFSMPTIIGLGLDATEIDRVAATMKRFGDRFLARIFTPGEIAYCTRRRTPAIHFAGRFAAKEAAMKALGTGRSRGVLWRDIEVVRRGGPPQLQFHGGAQRRFTAVGGRSSLLTITHSRDLALAQVLILTE